MESNNLWRWVIVAKYGSYLSWRLKDPHGVMGVDCGRQFLKAMRSFGIALGFILALGRRLDSRGSLD